MKNLFKKIENWLLNTQLGHFLSLMIIIIVFSALILIFIKGSFIGGLIGGGGTAIYFAFLSKKRNKKFW